MLGTQAPVSRGQRLLLVGLGLLTLASSVVAVVTTVVVPETVPEPRTLLTQIATIVGESTPVFFIPIAAVIIVRGGNRRIGWLLAVTGLALGFDLAVANYGAAYVVRPSLPLGPWAAWLDDFVWIIMILGVWLLVMCFPDGRPATRLGRALTWWFVAGTAVLLSAFPFHSGPLYDQPSVNTPLPRLPLLTAWGDFVPQPVVQVFVFTGFLLALAESIHRYLRAGPVQRAQLRWLAWAFALVVVFIASQQLPVIGPFMQVVSLGSILLVPAAVASAMFRERVYDIDRVVSRTVSYGLLTGLLFGIYAAVVATVSTVTPDSFGSVGVAVATLAVATLFVPLRRRLQAGVDRHFNRANYSARRTVEAFGVIARKENDPVAVHSELLRIVNSTMSPEHASIWLAPADSSAR